MSRKPSREGYGRLIWSDREPSRRDHGHPVVVAALWLDCPTTICWTRWRWTKKGRICVASLFNGGVWAISSDGMDRQHTPLPDLMTTNICFGGPDLQSAYVTLSSTGRLGRLQWDAPGQPLPFLNYQPGRRTG